MLQRNRMAEFAKQRTTVVSALFLLGLLVRLLFAVCHPHFNNIFAVRGEPFSDGLTWTAAGIHLASGEGLGLVYRPGFSVLLALFFVWFGYSAYFITGVQIIIGSLTVPLIYLIGERIFGRWIAASAAVFFIFDPSQLTQMPQATTEPLGLLCFAGSIYALLLVGGKRRSSSILLSGFLLALSNLTRPLTLFCVPFYGLQLLVDEWRQSRKLWPTLLPVVAFGFAILLTMSPWLIRQRAVQGVWAVSTNLGEALYAATSPKYGSWTSLVRTDADRAGVAPDPGSRYRYFVDQSWQNIRHYPYFYAKAVARSFLRFLNCFHPKIRIESGDFPFRQWTGLVEGQKVFAFILGVLLFSRAAWLWRRKEWLRGGVFLGVSASLALLWYIIPESGLLVLSIGIIAALWRFRWENVALLGWSIVGAGVGGAVFNNAILYRAVLMTDWIYSYFYFFAFCFVAEAMTCFIAGVSLGSGPGEIDSSTKDAPELHVASDRVIRLGRIAAGVFALFVLVGAIRLVGVSFRSSRAPIPLRLTDAARRGVIDRLRQISPAVRGAFPVSTAASLTFVEPQTPATGGVLESRDATPISPPAASNMARREAVVLYERPLPIVYYFPRGTDFAVRDPIFRKRSIDASVLRASRSMAVFPGKIPSTVLSGPVVIVGWLIGPKMDRSWPGHVIESIAIVPVTNKGKLDYGRAALAPPGGGWDFVGARD